MNHNTFTGRLNPDSGNPELLYTDGKGNSEVVADNCYESFAFYDNGDGSKYIVFSSYFEGLIPRDLIGVALKVTKVPEV